MDFFHKKNTRNLFRWKTVNQIVPMDTKTADSTTRPKKFFRRPKFLIDVQKIWKKEKVSKHFVSSLCACGLVNWSFDHPAKMFLSKIRKILAQVRNWLENENLNFKNFLKKFKRHSKKHFFQLSRKAFAKRWHFFCSMSKNDWNKRISSQKSGSPKNIFTDTWRAVFTTSPGNFQREADFFFTQCPETTKQIFNIKKFRLKKILRTRSKHFWRPRWET